MNSNLFSLLFVLTLSCRLGWQRREVEGTQYATKLTHLTTTELMMYTGKSEQQAACFCAQWCVVCSAQETFCFSPSQPRRSSLRWKYTRSLPGHLRRVWRWLWGRGTNCSYWEMHSHVQLPWYVTGCFSWLHYSLFLMSTVCIMRHVASQSVGWDVWGIVLDQMSVFSQLQRSPLEISGLPIM